MTQTNNPLRKYFRQPAIYLRLPSNGKHWPDGTLIMPPNSELPVFPMTAVDEITSRTPDALFNGSAVAEVVRSCVPNIRDPWAIPATDLAALMVAVRLASHGHDFEIGVACPECKTENDFTVDLRTVLDGLRSADYDVPLASGDLNIYFAPMSYKRLNENNRQQFEDQKMIQMLSGSDISDEEKLQKMGEAYKKLTVLNLTSVRDSISMIKTTDAMVSEPEYIMEFLVNCNKEMFDLIREKAIEMRRLSDIKPLSITCPDCKHEYQQEFTLDITNFFEAAS